MALTTFLVRLLREARVVRWCRPEEGEGQVDVAVREHASPREGDNVILYGQYVLDRAQVR